MFKFGKDFIQSIKPRAPKFFHFVRPIFKLANRNGINYIKALLRALFHINQSRLP